MYLFIDDTSGHGTNEVINEYDKNFNIKPVFQVSRTPYPNVLDIGIWCGLHATVKNNHHMRRCAADALV